MHQLEQKENAARYSLLSEERHCIELHSRVYSAQEELLKRLQCLKKLSTDFKNVVIYFCAFMVCHVGLSHKWSSL
jgi:hypothetical protein